MEFLTILIYVLIIISLVVALIILLGFILMELGGFLKQFWEGICGKIHRIKKRKKEKNNEDL